MTVSGEPDEPDDPIISGPDPVGAELASWGRVLLLETRGRRSGARRVTAVGFLEEPDGSYLVAAGGVETDWALNLAADPHCRITLGEVDLGCHAERLSVAETQRVVVDLIVRYGTPAEGLGRGPAFRLVPHAAPAIAVDPAHRADRA